MCDMRKCECATRTLCEGDTQVHKADVSIEVNSVPELCTVFVRAKRGIPTVPGLPADPHPFWQSTSFLLPSFPSPDVLATSISPPPFPNLPQDLTSSPSLPWALQVLQAERSVWVRSSWLPHSRSLLSVLTPSVVLSQLCSLFLSSTQTLTLSTLYPTHFFLSLRFLPLSALFVSSSCSWMPYWLGFLFTFTHILFSPSLYSFCSPVYCNAQTSLIRVFVSVYCFPKCLHLL